MDQPEDRKGDKDKEKVVQKESDAICTNKFKTQLLRELSIHGNSVDTT